jgi:hypothetical protein
VFRLRQTLTPLGAAVYGAGALAAVWPGRPRREAALLLSLTATYAAFAVLFRQTVLLQADLMPALLAATVLLALGLARLPAPGAQVAVVLMLVTAGWLTVSNYPRVMALTQDPRGVQYVEQFAALDAPADALVMAPWGVPYLSLAYAQRVEGRWPGWRLVDHRADLPALVREHGRVYTVAETALNYDRAWWANRLGEPLRVTSAGLGLVAISAQPLPPPTAQFLPVGDGLGLVNWRIAPRADGRLGVTLFWTCLRVPARDYSTFLYVSDDAQMPNPATALAQTTSPAPVYGWAPTRLWQPNELVREDYALAVPAGRTPRSVVVGFSTVDRAGAVVELGRLRLQETAGRWDYAP